MGAGDGAATGAVVGLGAVRQKLLQHATQRLHARCVVLVDVKVAGASVGSCHTNLQSDDGCECVWAEWTKQGSQL